MTSTGPHLDDTEPDAPHGRRKLPPLVFILVPVFVASLMIALTFLGALVGSVLVVAFVFSFAIMTPLTVFFVARELWLRRYR